MGSLVCCWMTSSIFCAAAWVSKVSTTATALGPMRKPAFEPERAVLAAGLSMAAEIPWPRGARVNGASGFWAGWAAVWAAHAAVAAVPAKRARATERVRAVRIICTLLYVAAGCFEPGQRTGKYVHGRFVRA